MESFTPEVKRLLREHGCTFHRQGKGDHEIWWSPITSRVVTVDGKIKSRHTANRILKDAGIDERLLRLFNEIRTTEQALSYCLAALWSLRARLWLRAQNRFPLLLKVLQAV